MILKVTFPSQERELAGSLTLPDQRPICYALFAHCFTCGQNSLAARRITEALAAQNIGVLRFDFTGLGNSEGDFGNTNFSSNLEDLHAAVEFLRQHYEAPALLIGHSLGGAAVLAIARDIPEVQAVASLAAPFKASHVLNNFESSLEDINQHGKAEVSLGGRPFTIKQQFITDVEKFNGTQLATMRKPLLIMHAPDDRIVSINDAEKIYLQAKHPKSFVSLDNADHLLSDKNDATYVAGVIASWSSRYVSPIKHQSKTPLLKKGQVSVSEKDHEFTQQVFSDSHQWLMDEPITFGGKDSGPDPYEHLLASLGGCTSMTLRMYAKRKKWPLTHVEVTLVHARVHAQDCQTCADTDTPIEQITRTIALEGPLSEEQRARLLEIADRCPVHRTLETKVTVKTQAKTDTNDID